MSAIALVLRAMGHAVSGSDLKDSPVVARLRSQGIAVAVGHRAENVGPVDAVTFSPAVPPDNPEIVAAARPGHPGGASLQRAGGDLCHPPVPGGGRHPRQDDDGLHAVADPGRGRAAAVVPHRCRRERDRDQRRVGQRRVAGGRGRRELRHLPGAAPGPGRADQRRADHLDHYGTFDELRTAFDGSSGRPAEGSVVSADDPEAAAIGRAYGALSVGTAEGADFTMSDVVQREARAPSRCVAPTAPWARCSSGCRACTTPATPRWPGRRSQIGGPLRGRGQRRWPASPVSPAGSSSGARRTA